MDLTSKKAVKELLNKRGVAPSKRLGQHFLVDKGVLKEILAAAGLVGQDTVLEIGPGIGTLTQELAKATRKVIAIEKDPRLAGILNDELRTMNIKNVKILQNDILKLDPNPYLLTPNYTVVANLPYYITSPVIRKFLESESPPRAMVLMVQKEVAQRICPRPPKLKERGRGKTSKMNLLAVSVQFYAKPEIISYVSKKSFWPQPKVDSAIIKIVSRQFRASVSRQFRERFFRIVRTGFAHPRKQLINNLSTGLKIGRDKVEKWLQKNNIQPGQRPETLSINNWIDLTKSLKT